MGLQTVDKMRDFLGIWIILSLLAATGLCAASNPIVFHLASASGGPDTFGYTWNDRVPFGWIDASAGSEAVFSEADDGVTEALPLGFNFVFYDRSYSTLFISTNGLISFENAVGDLGNQAFPNIIHPNNIIAPFWDDLEVGGRNSGKVYTLSGESQGQKYFVIEWYQIAISGNSTDLLTFEAILYEGGDICFQYQQAEGDLQGATVGIESHDGVDGLIYLYNEPGILDLVNNYAVCFERPGVEGRAKALPLYQSRFVNRFQEDFAIQVQNIGELGEDAYNISSLANGANWDIDFYHADGITPLIDTDGDTIVDTGEIQPDVAITITARVTIPSDAIVGDYSLINITATSSNSSHRSASSEIQAAIPASFAQAYADNQNGLNLLLVDQQQQPAIGVAGDFTGSTLSIARLENHGYLYTWEDHRANGGDLMYVIYNGLGQPVYARDYLTDNRLAEHYVSDIYPVVAALADGPAGVIWVRNITAIITETVGINSNIFLSILDSNGQILSPEIQITANNRWLGSEDTEAPKFANPSLAAISDDGLLLAWQEDRIVGDYVQRTIHYAIIDKNGNVIQPPTDFTQAIPGGNEYWNPGVAGLSQNRAILTYSIVDAVSSIQEIAYAILDSSSTLLYGPVSIADSYGWNPDAVSLSSGVIILSWTNLLNNRINCIALDAINFTTTGSPLDIPNPYDRIANFVSVSSTADDNAVLTWMDDEQNDYLYYALVSQAGALITPAMIFKTGPGINPYILTSMVGAGNAPYQAWSMYLPVIMR